MVESSQKHSKAEEDRVMAMTEFSGKKQQYEIIKGYGNDWNVSKTQEYKITKELLLKLLLLTSLLYLRLTAKKLFYNKIIITYIAVLTKVKQFI